MLLLALLALLSAAPLPSSARVVTCGTCANGGAPPMQNTLLTLACPAPYTISSILFASYGTPDLSGSCGAYSKGACDAANTSAVVSSLCLGKQSCGVFPNTTTFGDPCFGTVKDLSVEFICSSPSSSQTILGSAICGTVPPSPSSPNITATVSVPSWKNATGKLQIEPSIQVVSQHFLFRDSPIHDQSFATLAALGAKHVRWVPWIPYPSYGVGELMPPSPGNQLCGLANWANGGQSAPVTLDCGAGSTITSVDFASFGQPAGMCGNFAVNAGCHAPTSASVVSSMCVGRQSCAIPTLRGPSSPFGADPCPQQTATWLAVQVQCSDARGRTYWNLTNADNFLTDFWEAVDGDNSHPIPNFSTQPSWLYSLADYSWPENADIPWYGYDRGTAPAANLTQLGDYYGRLYAYFMQNGFTDEFGVLHTRTSGPPLNMSIIEIFNEVDYEHGHTAQSYTLEFDAVVRGIRKFADPEKRVQFVGLSLPNIDNTNTVVAWVTYFLNASNHAADARDALDYIGYHAYPTNGGYTPDPSTFSGLFVYADEFVDKVRTVDAIIARLSPSTLTFLDETGTDMDNVLTPGLSPPGNNPRYWVAAAGYFAYLFARLAVESPTVRVLGASQLMDAPGQEPSVTLLDWSTGLGTARFWVVKMLLEETDVGNLLVATDVDITSSDTDALFAQAFVGADGSSPKILLINKRDAWATVHLGSDLPCSSVLVLDESSGVSPAREEPCSGEGQVDLAPYAIAFVRLSL